MLESEPELLPDCTLQVFVKPLLADRSESEEVKVYFFLFKFAADEVDSVRQLVVLAGHSEEVLSADGFNDTSLLGHELLELLLFVREECIGTESGTLD